MTFSSGLLVALFGMTVVFAVLVALSLFIRLGSAAIEAIVGKKGKKNEPGRQVEHTENTKHDAGLMDSTGGNLKIADLGDDDAAAVIAAVAETGRLSGKNYVVKSIKPYGSSMLNTMDGELRLFNVDDETAAVVIAAMAHEGRNSGENLVVRSIKPLES